MHRTWCGVVCLCDTRCCAAVNVTYPDDDGKRIMHTELQIGAAKIFVHDLYPEWGAPGELACCHVVICVSFEDPDDSTTVQHTTLKRWAAVASNCTSKWTIVTKLVPRLSQQVLLSRCHVTTNSGAIATVRHSSLSLRRKFTPKFTPLSAAKVRSKIHSATNGLSLHPSPRNARKWPTRNGKQ